MKRRGLDCDEMSRRYAAHDLSPAEASKFEAHLAGCDFCKKQVAEWKELLSLLATPAFDAVRLEPSRDFDKPVMAFISGASDARSVEAATSLMTRLQAAGIPGFLGMERGALALRNAWDYYRMTKG